MECVCVQIKSANMTKTQVKGSLNQVGQIVPPEGAVGDSQIYTPTLEFLP